MKKKEPEVKQPSIEGQREYVSLRDNDPTEVLVRGKKFKLYWLHKGQIAKLSRLLIRKEDVDSQNSDGSSHYNRSEMVVEDSKLSCKAAAIYLLNGYWKLKFRYWFLWRWFYYIKQYDDAELTELLAEGKKKVPLSQFLANTMLLTGARDTLMMMRMEEAEHILQELSSEQPTQSAKESGA